MGTPAYVLVSTYEPARGAQVKHAPRATIPRDHEPEGYVPIEYRRPSKPITHQPEIAIDCSMGEAVYVGCCVTLQYTTTLAKDSLVVQ